MRKILEIFFKEKLIFMKLNEIVCECVAPLYTEEGGCVNISDIWAKGELKFTYLLEVSVVPYATTTQK